MNIKGEYQSGQLGQTVNLLSYDFIGSNPISPTINCRYIVMTSPRVYQRWGHNLFCNERGSSSVGRAIAFQAIGRGFEPRLPLSFEPLSVNRYPLVVNVRLMNNG